MTASVRYSSEDGIGWIELDDGKVNAMSISLQAGIMDALDEAERDGVVTVIRGRRDVFSAGFDLAVIRSGGAPSADMVLGGFELAHRVLGHPRPVLMACTGHAVAMGAFLLLSGDYRIGVRGPAKLVANEVAIGLTMPRTATEILRQRLTPAAFQRATLLAEAFDPTSGVVAGFLDEVADPEDFDDRVREIAGDMTRLDVQAQLATKRRTRAPLLDIIANALAEDRAEYQQRLESASETIS